MKILVTGSKGVVGSKLADELSKRGHIVYGVDLFHASGEVGFSQTMSSEENNYIRCDISIFRQIERVFETWQGIELVYNCGAEFGRWNGEDFYEQLWASNCIGLKNIIRLQEKLGFKLVHFSSSEVYGDFRGIMAESVMESVEIKQLNDYAITKWANEMQIRNSVALNESLQTVVVRLFNTYGDGEWYHPYRSVNSKFCYHVLMGLPITVYTGHWRTSTYIWDCVNAVANISENFIANRTYNIGSSQNHSIEDLVKIIYDYLPDADKSLINYKSAEKLTTLYKEPDISLSVKELGFAETVSLKEGVQRTIDWMKKYYNKL